MTTITQPATVAPVTPPAAAPGSSLVRASLAIARRSVLKFFRSPQLVVVSTVQGAMFLLIFRYVFGGAIQVPGGIPYVDFLVPGFVATGVLFTGSSASVSTAEDVESGLFDRLRSLPAPRASVLTGRAVADTMMLAWGTAVTTAVGFAVGFRLHGSILEGVVAFLFCIAMGFVFEWMFIFIGLIAGNGQAAQGMSLLIFPLTFVSSAFVPVDSMPSGVRWVAEHQPITPMVNTVRALCLGDHASAVLGHDTTYWLVRSVIWGFVLIGIFLPLAVRRFNRS